MSLSQCTWGWKRSVVCLGLGTLVYPLTLLIGKYCLSHVGFTKCLPEIKYVVLYIFHQRRQDEKQKIVFVCCMRAKCAHLMAIHLVYRGWLVYVTSTAISVVTHFVQIHIERYLVFIWRLYFRIVKKPSTPSEWAKRLVCRGHCPLWLTCNCFQGNMNMLFITLLYITHFVICLQCSWWNEVNRIHMYLHTYGVVKTTINPLLSFLLVRLRM